MTRPIDWVNAFLACSFLGMAIVEAARGEILMAVGSVAVAGLCLYDLCSQNP